MNEKMNGNFDDKSSGSSLGFFRSILLMLALLLVIILLGFMVQAKKEKIKNEQEQALKTEDPGINVIALKISPRTIRDRINLPGRIEPFIRLDIYSEVQGKVTQKNLSKGQSVSKGDLFLSIDSERYQNGFAAAKASFETSLASKKRLESLYQKQFSNKSELDSITAQVESLKASMENAALDLANCRIESPISGMINDIFVEEGEFITPGKKLAEILQLDRVKIIVGIPESDINDVKNIETFKISVDALDGRTFEARKHFLSKSTGFNEILYKMELVSDNASHELLPGMFTRVEIVKKEIENSISVPIYSVISTNGTQSVYTANNGTAEIRNVALGIQEGWMIQIKSGLTEGDNVIVTGQRNVADGQKINIVKVLTDLKELGQ